MPNRSLRILLSVFFVSAALLTLPAARAAEETNRVPAAAPATVSTNDTPADAATNAAPTGSSTNATPVEVSAHNASADVSTNVAPIEVATNSTPVDAATNTTPAEVSTNRAPAAASTDAAAPAETPAPTNRAPTVAVQRYIVSGNSLLPKEVIADCFTNRFGTNVTVDTILKGATDLQLAYRERGFQTVSVILPQQTISNETVRVEVLEGTLAEILVKHNRYFSSNNVMRALPGLETNLILNSSVFQAELDKANANRDRQIYPRIEPGPEPDTSSLVLDVKDRLPLHAKTEINNKSTPNTPDLRLDSTIAYNNLWQREHSLGLQYTFSPGYNKLGDQWNFYDQPLIANYSAYYRLPLSAPEAVGDTVESRPNDFGYDEASHKFRLPPSSGQAELNVYGSRSTIDTGVTKSGLTRLFTSDVRTIDQRDDHQDITITEDLGFRLSKPLPPAGTMQSTLSGGLDWKHYKISSFDTNIFIFTEFLFDENNNPLPPRVSETPSPTPPSHRALRYVPLSLRWDGGWKDAHGNFSFGIGYSPNLWTSDGLTEVQSLGTNSLGRNLNPRSHWHIVNASLTREQILPGDWKLSLHADGQWANEPLISNEQYGLGGLDSVRGYQEGQVYGDRGWRTSIELKSPSALAGVVDAKQNMYVRGTLFFDYGQSYLLHAQAGQKGETDLSGVGFGVYSVIGSTWEGRLLFAWPLNSVSGQVHSGETHVYFGISAQF